MNQEDFVSMEHMVGKVIKSIEGLEKYSEEVYVYTVCGLRYRFFHPQDCCELVNLEDFEADSENLTGALIVSAEESSNQSDTSWGSETWTFYKIETNRGGIWMRWHGESNGYYSEDVSLSVSKVGA